MPEYISLGGQWKEKGKAESEVKDLLSKKVKEVSVSDIENRKDSVKPRKTTKKKRKGAK